MGCFSGRKPSSVQIASLLASFVMITKTAIADFLSEKQPMELKDELKATASLLPLFLSNGVFKVLSLAIIATCLRYVPFFLFLVVKYGPMGLKILWGKIACSPMRFISEDLEPTNVHFTTLRLREDSGATKRQRMESCVLNNFAWGIFHFVVLTCLVKTANTNPDSLNYTVTNLGFSINGTIGHRTSDINMDGWMSRTQSSHISKRPGLVDNLPLLNGLYVGILAAMAINATLFYFQMWKPMVEEELVKQRTSDELASSRTAIDDDQQDKEGDRMEMEKK